jgi:hypothetical protein
MLLPFQIAHLEHRERIRAFNVRAARGEFVRYTDDPLQSARPVQWSERLGKLSRVIGHRFSRHLGRSLVIQPGVDSA